MAYKIGVDLGGTKVEIAALDDEGRIRLRRRTPTPGRYDEIVETIAGMVRRAEDELDAPCTVGVGIPGTISPATGLVKNANSQALIGHRLDRDLAAATGRPVRIANDANCLALSEAVDGAGAGERGVHLGLEVDGRRRVREIVAVPGRVENDIIETETVFERRGGELRHTGGMAPHPERYEQVGIDVRRLLGRVAGPGGPGRGDR